MILRLTVFYLSFFVSYSLASLYAVLSYEGILGDIQGPDATPCIRRTHINDDGEYISQIIRIPFYPGAFFRFQLDENFVADQEYTVILGAQEDYFWTSHDDITLKLHTTRPNMTLLGITRPGGLMVGPGESILYMNYGTHVDELQSPKTGLFTAHDGFNNVSNLYLASVESLPPVINFDPFSDSSSADSWLDALYSFSEDSYMSFTSDDDWDF